MKKYEILGGNLPVVVCELSAGESMITESGTVIYKGEEIGTFPWSVALGYCSIESENPSLTVMINDDGTLKVDYSDDDDYYTFHCVKSDSE